MVKLFNFMIDKLWIKSYRSRKIDKLSIKTSRLVKLFNFMIDKLSIKTSRLVE